VSERKIQFLPTGVAPSPNREPPPRSASVTTDTSALWREVLAKLDDDAAHQAFIRACTSQGRLSFALESYRTLEKLRPGDPVAARYLTQVAKLLEIGALGVSSSRQIELQNRLVRGPMRLMIGMVIALVGILIIYMVVSLARAALR
jgi:hypothetical protein